MRKIKRKCKCGCRGITNYGKKYIDGHNSFGNTHLFGHKHSKETKKKMSLVKIGKRFSEEHKLKISLSRMECNPNYEYCEIWHDREYRKDLRKDCCENVDCKKNYKRLDSHHIYLDKKRCAPKDIMTFCASCHTTLHNQLGKPANPKDYIIINRSDHVSYIHKKNNKIIRINKRR